VFESPTLSDVTGDELLPFAQVSEETYAEVAAEYSGIQLIPSERDPELILIDGICARCHHRMVFHTPIVIYRDANWAPMRDKLFNTVLRKAARQAGKRTVTVYCRCGEPHPGAPDNGEGCGAYWKLNVEWGIPDDDPDHSGTSRAAE
jgi:hypothetical protein